MTETLPAASADELPLKQLRMTAQASALRDLPEVPLPEGRELRPYRPGDEPGWLELLQAAGFEEWDRVRLDAFLEDRGRREGSRIVAEGKTVVAATFASRTTLDDVEIGVLDYVASSPEHRGKGLGRAVCTAVTRFLVSRGHPAVTLTTDDWRLPAIGLYLSMGFVPIMHREDMPGRWDAIMQQLAIRGPTHGRDRD